MLYLCAARWQAHSKRSIASRDTRRFFYLPLPAFFIPLVSFVRPLARAFYTVLMLTLLSLHPFHILSLWNHFVFSSLSHNISHMEYHVSIEHCLVFVYANTESMFSFFLWKKNECSNSVAWCSIVLSLCVRVCVLTHLNTQTNTYSIFTILCAYICLVF